MSADLLRRAAAALRQHLADLEEPHPDEEPWYTAKLPQFGTRWAKFAEVHPEDARFIELMSPPVAVALADLLDQFAEIIEGGESLREQHPALAERLNEPERLERKFGRFFAVARAVLREER